jgi:RNA polymerase sigma factor (sigma-70 family)
LSSTLVRLDPERLRLLMSRVAAGDSKAFRSLYDETSSKLFGCALRILHKPELAEDVLQESFVRVWRSACDYRSSLSAPMTWMTTIVRNKALDALRSEHCSPEIDFDDFDKNILNTLIDWAATPLEALEASRNNRLLESCLVELDSAHRQVVYMAFFNDFSHSEIAHELALPLGTVKTWIRRSLEKLGTRLCKLEVSTHSFGQPYDYKEHQGDF